MLTGCVGRARLSEETYLPQGVKRRCCASAAAEVCVCVCECVCLCFCCCLARVEQDVICWHVGREW